MRKLLLFFVLTLLGSCTGIQYDGEKRLVLQTTVTKGNGEPLPNSHVQVIIDNSSIISEGTTDANGTIVLIFPSPSNDLPINLTIYNDDASYLQKEILNIRKSDFENYKFVFQNAHLLKSDETAALHLSYFQSSFNTYVSRVNVNGYYYMPFELYNSSTDNYYLPEEILIRKNQAFQLKYMVMNTQTHIETEHSVDLTIGTAPLDYTINY